VGVTRSASRTQTHHPSMHRLIYISAIALLCGYAWLHPLANWDRIGYAGAVLAAEGKPLTDIHTGAYATVANTAYYDALIGDRGTSAVARRDVYRNPYHFAELLPLYSNKPLYTMSIELLHRSGFGLVAVICLASIVSFAALAILLWTWTGKYLSGWGRVLAAIGLLLVPPLWTVHRMAVPDGLSLVVCLLGLYLITETQLVGWGASALVLSVWIRPDNLALILAILVVLASGRSLSRITVAVLAGFAVMSAWVIAHYSTSYPFASVLHFSLVERLTPVGESVAGLPPESYVHALARCAVSFFTSGGCLIIPTVYATVRWGKSTLDRRILFALIAGSVTHLIVYPDFQPRYFVVLWIFALTQAVFVAKERLHVAWYPASALSADLGRPPATDRLGVYVGNQ
jgi:hypothetical protein